MLRRYSWLFVFILAFVVRLLCVIFFYKSTPYGIVVEYELGALSLAKLVFALLGALVPIISYLLGRDIFSEEIGLGAGILVAVYPLFVVLSVNPSFELVELLLFLVFLWMGVRVFLSPSFVFLVAVGVIGGLVFLYIPYMRWFPALYFVWMLFTMGSGSWKSALLYVIGFMLIFLLGGPPAEMFYWTEWWGAPVCVFFAVPLFIVGMIGVVWGVVKSSKILLLVLAMLCVVGASLWYGKVVGFSIVCAILAILSSYTVCRAILNVGGYGG